MKQHHIEMQKCKKRSREGEIYHVTIMGSLVNVALLIIKFAAGIIGNSAAMIADAVHSLSDFATDIVVLVFVRIGNKPEDEDHDYGHGKYETLASAIIGMSLLVVGAMICYNGIYDTCLAVMGKALRTPGWVALAAAMASILLKEWAYRFTVAVGKRVGSQAVVANAWHHRSDSLSSVGTFLGVGGAILLGSNWAVLDSIAAIIVSFFIMGAALKLLKQSTDELMEKSLPHDMEEEIESIVGKEPCVSSMHHLRTRRIGNNIAISMHVRLPGETTLYHAHEHASSIERKLREHFGESTFIALHLEPTKVDGRYVEPTKTRCMLPILLIAAATLTMTTGCGCSDNNKEEADSVVHRNNIPVDTALRSRLADFANSPRPQGDFAFKVYDLTAEKTVYSYNENMALPSASCMKLLSGIAGLHLLGCDYQYETTLAMRGNVDAEGTLKGDIAFKAGLDPQLMEADLQPFAKALKDKGVKAVSGKLIVDLVVAEPVTSEGHWFPWDLTFSKYGLLYKGDKRIVRALRATLRGQGIATRDSQIVMARVPEGFTTVYTSTRSIEDVVKRMWKNSSNTQATAMLYTIGHHFRPQRHPVPSGVIYLKNFLRSKLGHRDSRLVIHDGCGLCVYNRLSPNALTAILEYGYKDKDIRGMLERNLSIAGVDGTLAREMCGQKVRGKVKGKTGTLSHPYGISSLAGLCEGSNGHMLAFAIMDSRMSVLDARVLQRKLCEAMVK